MSVPNAAMPQRQIDETSPVPANTAEPHHEMRGRAVARQSEGPLPSLAEATREATARVQLTTFVRNDHIHTIAQHQTMRNSLLVKIRNLDARHKNLEHSRGNPLAHQRAGITVRAEGIVQDILAHKVAFAKAHTLQEYYTRTNDEALLPRDLKGVVASRFNPLPYQVASIQRHFTDLIIKKIWEFEQDARPTTASACTEWDIACNTLIGDRPDLDIDSNQGTKDKLNKIMRYICACNQLDTDH